MINLFNLFIRPNLKRYFLRILGYWLLIIIIVMLLDKYALGEKSNYAFLFSFETTSSSESRALMYRKFPLNYPEMQKLFPPEKVISFDVISFYGFMTFIFPIPFIWWNYVLYNHTLIGAELWDWYFTIWFHDPVYDLIQKTKYFRNLPYPIEFFWWTTRQGINWMNYLADYFSTKRSGIPEDEYELGDVIREWIIRTFKKWWNK